MIRRMVGVSLLSLVPTLVHANAFSGLYMEDFYFNLYGNSASYITGSPGAPVATLNGGWYSIYGPGNDSIWPGDPYQIGSIYGAGSANDSTGTLKAITKAVFSEEIPGIWRPAWTTSEVRGVVSLGSDSLSIGDAATFSINVAYDGSFAGDAPGVLAGGVNIFARKLGATEWLYATDSINNYSGVTASNAVLNIDGVVGDAYELIVALTSTVQWCSACEADFSHTAQLSFGTQDGVSLLGNDGFLDAVPTFAAFSVPEPSSIAMLLAGLGAIGFSARKKKGA